MNNLRKIRQEKGLSQKALTDILNNKLGVSISMRTLQNWEADKTPIKSEAAQQLADYFEVSVPYLLGFATNPIDFDLVKIFSVSQKEPNKEIVEAGKLLFQKLTPKNSDRKLEDAIFKESKKFYEDGKVRNKDNLNEKELETLFGEQHVISSSAQRLNNFYQALPLLEVTEAAIISYFALLSETQKNAIYDILTGLIFHEEAPNYDNI